MLSASKLQLPIWPCDSDEKDPIKFSVTAFALGGATGKLLGVGDIDDGDSNSVGGGGSAGVKT